MNKIRIKYGENEIEVEGTDEFINNQLSEFYGKMKEGSKTIFPSTIKKDLVNNSIKAEKVIDQSPAEFYRQRGKSDGISQLLIFAKYLELYQNKTEFTKQEINKLAKDAKLPKDIHSQYFTNAVKQGLLRSMSGGRYSLTLSAEEVLAAM